MDKRYRVLHLIDSSGLYGPESVIMTLSRGMLGTNFLPLVGCFVTSGGEPPEIASTAAEVGIEVLLVNQSRIFDWWTLRSIIKQNKIDIIHCHGYKGSVLAYIAEGFRANRIIVTCHRWSRETLRLKI
jgi:hypothetical protein